MTFKFLIILAVVVGGLTGFGLAQYNNAESAKQALRSHQCLPMVDSARYAKWCSDTVFWQCQADMVLRNGIAYYRKYGKWAGCK